uniref:Uncharacterized protein n=1 Tax=Anguilla anguilla TaxID=7936 RepID=A0A0E9SV20_ANGAN
MRACVCVSVCVYQAWWFCSNRLWAYGMGRVWLCVLPIKTPPLFTSSSPPHTNAQTRP